MAASRYSVGIGPVPVPPERSGSSTTSSNPLAVTRHRQPPSHRAITELVCSVPCSPPGALGPRLPSSLVPRSSVQAAPRPGVACAARSFLVVMPVVVPVIGTVVVTGGPGRELVQPGPQVVGGDQAHPADQPLQGAQPALVVAPALAGRMAGLPLADLADQRLAEVLPVDAPG